MKSSADANTTPKRQTRTFQTAVDRWASVGPYYAMFPVDFALDVIEKYTQPGDRVLDPFVGRGSSIYAAAARGRNGCGIEINPVGWLYSIVKLRPTEQGPVLKRLQEIGRAAAWVDVDQARLPIFFTWAYAPTVLRFLITAREELRWKKSRVDQTLMTFILIYLHGRRSFSLSNQMRDSKAMAPDYAIRWWQERDMYPPEINPITFLEQRIAWRYTKGYPELEGDVLLGDSVNILTSNRVRRALNRPFNFLFTSPPYFGITNYHYDQWLRLWMLGQSPTPRRPEGRGRWQRKFESQSDYRELLLQVFQGAARRLHEEAVVFVRTDARPFTLLTTTETLSIAFPNKHLTQEQRPVNGRTQTLLYGDYSKKPGEVDIILTPR